MSFGIIRVRKLNSASQINALETHNARLYGEMGLPIPENIKPENEGKFGHNHHCTLIDGCETDKSVLDAIYTRINGTGAKMKKNSVLALEYVVALSPDCKTAYESRYSAGGMLSNLKEYIAKKHGRENIVSISYHFDETNPHAHVVVVPIVRKLKRTKNKYKESIKEEYALSARDLVGGKEQLRQLQTDFYEYVKPYGPKLGVEFYRGVDAREQKRHYVKETFHALGELEEQKRILQKQLIDVHYQDNKAKQTGKETFDRLDPFRDQEEKKKPGMGM